MLLQPPKSSLSSIKELTAPQTENDTDKKESKLENDKLIFPNILENLFAKINQTDDRALSSTPFSVKKDADIKSDENSLLLNPIFTPFFLLQNTIQTNNEILPFQQKGQLSTSPNNLMKVNLLPIDNFSLGEYKLYPIYPDNLNLSKNIQPKIEEENFLQNLLKYDACDLQLIKNEIVPEKNILPDNKTEFIQDLQKWDLVSLNPIENKINNNILPINPKINIEISSFESENSKIDTHILNKNYLDILEKGNPKQEILSFGDNFFGYPVSHLENNNSLKTDYYLFKKENSTDGEKKILIGVLSKDDTGEKELTEQEVKKQMKPLLLGYQEDKPKFSKIMTLDSLKHNINKLLNSYLKNNNNELFDTSENGIDKNRLKSLFANVDRPVFHNNIEDKEIVSENFINTDENHLKDFKIESPKAQQDLLKNTDTTLKNKNFQNPGIFKFENITKDKKTSDLFKNGINQLNIEKLKLEMTRNKDSREDTFFSFMSSQSENDNKENNKGIEEKNSNDGKGIVFEKGISSHVATPIVSSDKSTIAYSNSIVTAATTRAMDLSSQLQARGGGSAKIQIQDDKFGNIELNIHMKKDNTVTMEIKASDKDLKNILEKNSDTLKKSLDNQNISLTDFKVSTVEKSIQAGMSGSASQGFSQQQSHHNSQNSNFNSQDMSQQALNQGFLSNNSTNGNPFFKNPDEDYSFNKYTSQNYVNKNVSFNNMEKNSITNIQRGANGSIKVLV